MEKVIRLFFIPECPYCIAPEIVLKSKELDQSVDIWSLGCIVIEMATNKPPWSAVAKTVQEVIQVIANSNVPPKFPSHLSKECKEFLFNCLKKNPIERYSARKLLEHEFFKSKTLFKASKHAKGNL
jgi:serine/threonine protein kinase